MNKILFLCSMSLLTLGGCGVKPVAVDPPPNVEADRSQDTTVFPRRYPAK
jgi:predicted small lipoprotein YifL